MISEAIAVCPLWGSLQNRGKQRKMALVIGRPDAVDEFMTFSIKNYLRRNRIY
jgi:hypothetical protein